MNMFLLVLYLVYSIQFLLSNCTKLLFENSNCSFLLFNIQMIDQSNKIQTNFPIQFIINYNLTCNIENLTAHYEIVPLSILNVNNHYTNIDESVESLIDLNQKNFTFNINQSSTVRLCVLLSDNNNYRICRQIHIGLNTLYEFWTLPMKIFYIILIVSLSTYYILFFLREKWRQGCKKSKVKASVFESLSIKQTYHDTFENEKIHENAMPGKEDAD